MTVHELLGRISGEEISEWIEFWRLEAADRPKPATSSPENESEADGD